MCSKMDSEKCFVPENSFEEERKEEKRNVLKERERIKEGKPDLDFHNDWFFHYPFLLLWVTHGKRQWKTVKYIFNGKKYGTPPSTTT